MQYKSTFILCLLLFNFFFLASHELHSKIFISLIADYSRYDALEYYSVKRIHSLSEGKIKDYELPPSVTLTTEDQYSNKDTIVITASWSKVVNGFDEEDVIINSLAGLSRLENIDGQIYLLKVVPIQEGEIVLTINPNAVYDNNQISNEKGDSIKITYDKTAPSAKLFLEDKLYTDYNLNLEISLSEVISSGGINLDLTNADLQSIKGKELSYVANIFININQGTALAFIPENSFFDAAGNGNLRSDTLKIRYDTEPLTVNISSVNSQYISDSTLKELSVTFTFNEPVQEFDKKHFSLYNADIKELIKINETVYELKILLPKEPEVFVEIFINENSILNEVGFPNPVGAEYFFLVDKSPPEVEILSHSGLDIFNTVRIDIYFDDPVFNYQSSPIWCTAFDAFCFTERDVNISGGEIHNFNGNFDHFSFDLTPFSQRIEINIPANVALNAVDAGNKASNTLILQYANGVVSVIKDENNVSDIHYWIENNSLNLEMNTEYENAKIYLFDLNGKVLLFNSIDDYKWQNDISFISKGVYLLMVVTDEEVFKRKILIAE